MLTLTPRTRALCSRERGKTTIHKYVPTYGPTCGLCGSTPEDAVHASDSGVAGESEATDREVLHELWNYIEDSPMPGTGRYLISFLVGKNGPFVRVARFDRCDGQGRWSDSRGCSLADNLLIYAWRGMPAPAPRRPREGSDRV